MSVNRVNENTGELVTLSSGVRMWIGTKAAHTIAVANHTIPNNVMVCITDDYDDQVADVVEDGNMKPVTSNAVYNAMQIPKFLEVSTADQNELETNFKTLFPNGIFLVFWHRGGSHDVLLVQNTDPDWYSYLWFGYGQRLLQRRHTPQNGWETFGILPAQE